MTSLSTQEVFEIRIELYKWDRVFLKLKWRFFGRCCYIKSHVFKMAINGVKLVCSFKRKYIEEKFVGLASTRMKAITFFCVVPTNGGATLTPAHDNLHYIFYNWAWFTTYNWCESGRFTIRCSSSELLWTSEYEKPFSFRLRYLH